MMPFDDVGLASGLLCGFLFGYVLENAGFGSACKLTAQFEMRDWSVFKVMFPAIIVAAFGLAVLRGTGLLRAEDVFVPTTFLWATLAGGALVGVGFAVGGYCPGTSVVAFASGRLDGLVFLVGLVAGTVGFAALFPGLEGFLGAAAGPDGQTLSQLLGVSDMTVVAILVVAAFGGFYAGGRLERRFRGPIPAEDTVAAAAGPR